MKQITSTKNKLACAALGAVSGLLTTSGLLTVRHRVKTKIEQQEFQKAQQPDHGIKQRDTTTKQIPTLYVHGFRGGDYTTNKMVLSAQRVTATHTFLKVLVDWRGNLTYEGRWSNDPNPLVQVVFRDKWMPTRQIVNWLDIVLPELKEKYHFEEYNAVGHSIGATALVRVEMRNYDNAIFPRLNKLVLVAGPFDGVVAFGDWPNINRLLPSGRPVLMNPHYLQLLLNRDRFPSNVSVLNIYGNIDDDSNTDKYISVISAKSIRYILTPIVKAFHEIEIHGNDAEHSKMHDDDDVLNIINRFLFGQHTEKSTS
ncbi:alpha/beta hydrolase [Lapidilactobacillus bayanensis]|uniref:alpha/beta hydrolase n=1 Tax=Lapidilactobacillus bayanensis TaxID=2485998 RepID=UPI001CDBBAC3|nr:alpha/beta hydrolase [Lapidilactobacillus bayanensis]